MVSLHIRIHVTTFHHPTPRYPTKTLETDWGIFRTAQGSYSYGYNYNY